LQPGTEYRFKISAENEVGKSKYSLEVAATTEEEPPSGPPVNTSAYAVGSREVHVAWSPPAERTRNGVILGYNVGYRHKRHGPAAPFNFTEVPVLATKSRPDFGQLSARLTGLEPFSTYEVVVQAFNGMGVGPLSNGMFVTTREESE
jgi:hypothetical protein